MIKLNLKGRCVQAYELYLDDDRYAVPTLHLITVADEAACRVAAERLLQENTHYRGVEICQDGERLTGFGSFATRRLPPERMVRQA